MTHDIDTVENIKKRLYNNEWPYLNRSDIVHVLASDYCVSKELSDHLIDKFIAVLVRDHVASSQLDRDYVDHEDTIILLDKGSAGTYFVNVHTNDDMDLSFYRSVELDIYPTEFDNLHPLYPDKRAWHVLSGYYMLLDFDSQETYKDRIKKTLEVLAL